MKKRCVLFAVILALAMMVTACGGAAQSSSPFEGQWVGTLDVTKQFEDGIKAKYPELKEFINFEDLVFTMDVQFEDGEMSMVVHQESVDTFTSNFEAGMQQLGKECLEDWLETQDMTLEEVIAESGVDETSYFAQRYAQMGITDMTANMKKVTNTSLDGLSKVKGAYTFDKENIHLSFEDNTFEEIKYEFEGDNLILTIYGDGFSLCIVCEKG